MCDCPDCPPTRSEIEKEARADRIGERQFHLRAAREAVIQAAKAWRVGIAPRLSYDSGEEQALDEAVITLNTLENDNGTD